MPEVQDIASVSAGSDTEMGYWLESLRLMAGMLGSRRPFLSTLTDLLRLLASRHDFLRAHLVLFEPETGLLRLCLADTPPRAAHDEYTPGVGVTGQVFATGKAVIVEKMQGHPLFMSLLFERTEEELRTLSFISVPILAPSSTGGALSPGEVVGTLNADTRFLSREDLELRCLFLRVVAALIANEAAYLQEEMARQHRPPLNEEESENVSGAEGERQSELISQSKVMRHILDLASHMAQGRTPILLRGEPGVGKERLAARIHAGSPRRDMPLLSCHCAALAPEHQEAELCGYQKGSFLGASQTRKGIFEQANLGTLFLDAVESLTLSAQRALLRLIQRQEVLRMGADEPVNVDVRVIASSAADLEDLVEKGRFLPELLARLEVSSLRISPLRERREDIIPLAEHVLRRYAAERQGEGIKRISYPALELLTRYYWPGNVSELKNCLLRAAQYSGDQVIRAGDLPPSLQTAESTATEAGLSLGDAVARFEKELLVDALIKAGGNMLKAARDLKSSYRIVNYKVKKYGIDPHRFAFRNGQQ